MITNRVIAVFQLIVACCILLTLNAPSDKIELTCRGLFESPNAIKCYEQWWELERGDDCVHNWWAWITFAKAWTWQSCFIMETWKSKAEVEEDRGMEGSRATKLSIIIQGVEWPNEIPLITLRASTKRLMSTICQDTIHSWLIVRLLGSLTRFCLQNRWTSITHCLPLCSTISITMAFAKDLVLIPFPSKPSRKDLKWLCLISAIQNKKHLKWFPF